MPISKGQDKLAAIVKGLLRCQVIQNFRGFKWLSTENGKQEIDIWVPKFKLAIEYDGEQHFRPVKFSAISDDVAQKEFAYRQFLDNIKNQKINDNPDDVSHFIRIKYSEILDKQNIESKLKCIGIIIPAERPFYFDDMLDAVISPYSFPIQILEF